MLVRSFFLLLFCLAFVSPVCADQSTATTLSLADHPAYSRLTSTANNEPTADSPDDQSDNILAKTIFWPVLAVNKLLGDPINEIGTNTPRKAVENLTGGLLEAKDGKLQTKSLATVAGGSLRIQFDTDRVRLGLRWPAEKK